MQVRLEIIASEEDEAARRLLEALLGGTAGPTEKVEAQAAPPAAKRPRTRAEARPKTEAKAPEAEPTEDTAPAAEAADGPLTTAHLESLRPIIQDGFLNAGKRDKFMSVMQEFGVAKLPDLPEADYEAFLAALQEVLK
jgi:hypothetical protein